MNLLLRHIEGGIAASHDYVFLVEHAVIDIAWMLFGERFRDNRNVRSDFHFLRAMEGFGNCLQILDKLLINKYII